MNDITFQVPSSTWEFWPNIQDLEPYIPGTVEIGGSTRSLGHVNRDGTLVVDCLVEGESNRGSSINWEGCRAGSCCSNVASKIFACKIFCELAVVTDLVAAVGLTKYR